MRPPLLPVFLHPHNSIKGSSLKPRLFCCRLPTDLPVFYTNPLSPTKFYQHNVHEYGVMAYGRYAQPRESG